MSRGGRKVDQSSALFIGEDLCSFGRKRSSGKRKKNKGEGFVSLTLQKGECACRTETSEGVRLLVPHKKKVPECFRGCEGGGGGGGLFEKKGSSGTEEFL